MKNWIYLLMVLAVGGLVAFRIYGAIKRLRLQRGDDWDERLVKNLRAQGGDPFSPYEVDFFFAASAEQQCVAIAAALSGDGYSTDYRAMDTEGVVGYTLHARKALRVSVPLMQSLSAQFRALAEQHGAAYDGWATAGVTKPAEPRLVLRGRR